MKNKQMSEGVYELLRKRFYSKPPFVFYFNPNIELEEKVDNGSVLKIGFFVEGTNVSTNSTSIKNNIKKHSYKYC